MNSYRRGLRDGVLVNPKLFILEKVNLGPHTNCWSNLVKLSQTWSNVLKTCIIWYESLHSVQAFKDQFSRTSPSNTSKNPIECMDAPLNNVQKFPFTKFVKECENGLEIENKALLNNLDDEESLLDILKFEEVSQVMAIDNILVKIDTFTFPMDFVTWGIERDLQNSHILRRPLLSSSQARIDINKRELTLLVGEEKAKFNLHQPLPLTEQERAMCRKFCSLLQSKGHMFE